MKSKQPFTQALSFRKRFAEVKLAEAKAELAEISLRECRISLVAFYRAHVRKPYSQIAATRKKDLAA